MTQLAPLGVATGNCYAQAPPHVVLFELEDEKGAKKRGLYHPDKLKLVNEESVKDTQESGTTVLQAASPGGDV